MRGLFLLVALSCLAAQSCAAQCNVAPICCNDCATCFPAGQPLFDCFASCTPSCPTVQQCLQFDSTVARNIANAGCSFARESCSPTIVTTAQHVTPIECYFIQFGECVGSSQGFFTSQCASFSRGTCSEQQFYNYFNQFVTDTCQAVAVRVLGP